MGMFDDFKESELIGPSPPWLYLLAAPWRAWRESQIMKGRNPDTYIEEQLVEAGKWPPKESDNASRP